jgi:hypothetical protein
MEEGNLRPLRGGERSFTRTRPDGEVAPKNGITGWVAGSYPRCQTVDRVLDPSLIE